VKATASACAAGTVINAISTWKGSAFAVDLRTHAEVYIDDTGDVRGEVTDRDLGPELIERTAERVLNRFATDKGATVKTRSDVPPKSGMKSSSAAANATTLATVAALGRREEVDDLETIRIGVRAAIDAGVTITGAFDDAAASYLGGLVFTDNEENELIECREMEGTALFYVPGEASTTDADVDRAKLLSPLVQDAFDTALRGEVKKALILNGILHCASLGYDPEPAIAALEAGAEAAGLSGTGPTFTALPGPNPGPVEEAWRDLPGKVLKAPIDPEGARVEEV